ncbi:MAG: hypothetical protein GY717_17005 [Rhodobacteraceae bacterium]|nr:hypothetical protein [Paracoccaceae bacterium]
MKSPMRHVVRGALTALALGMLALPAVAQTSYVMTCRSGGDMSAVAGQRVSNPHVFVEITFQPGTAGAGVQAPDPGQCTWIDRGFRPGEPNKMIYDDHAVAWTQTVCRAGGCGVNTPSSGARQLIGWVRNGQPFQVHVYNNNSGHMVVTKIGP